MAEITKTGEQKLWHGNRKFLVQFVVGEDYTEDDPPTDDVDVRLDAGIVEEGIRGVVNPSDEPTAWKLEGGITVVPSRTREELLSFISFVWDKMSVDWDHSDQWDAIIEGVRGLEQMTSAELLDEYMGLWDEMWEDSYQQARDDGDVDPKEHVKIPFNLAQLEELVNSDPTDAHELLRGMLEERKG